LYLKFLQLGLEIKKARKPDRKPYSTSMVLEKPYKKAIIEEYSSFFSE
jgi:hypothetical protein